MIEDAISETDEPSNIRARVVRKAGGTPAAS